MRYTTPYEIKADAAGVFRGHGAIFDSVDLGGDLIEPGAFSETLAEIKSRGVPLPLLWAHDQHTPVGKFSDLREDDIGLRVEGRLTLKTKAAQEAYALLQDRAVTGLSIGYGIRKGGSEQKGDIRILKNLDLHEISLVAIPMHRDARITHVKSALDCQHPRELERLLRDKLGLSSRKAIACANAMWPIVAGDDEIDPNDIVAEIASINSFLRGSYE